MSRLTKKANHYCDTDIDNEYKFVDEDTSIGTIVDKLGQLEDLEEEIGVNNLVAFLEWLVKFRNNFMCKSFDDMIAFYKKAMCETEKDKSE